MITSTASTPTARGEERPSKSALLNGQVQGTTARPGATRKQVRLRLGQATAEQLRCLPHGVRAEVVTLVVNAALARVPVSQLVGYRQELKNLGLLLNQSLRSSRGKSVDVVALAKVVEVVNKLMMR